MRFINNIDTVTSAHGRGAHFFFEVPYLVNTTVRCGVYLNDGKRALGVDIGAGYTFITGFARGAEFRILGARYAVEEFCEKPRSRRFARPARTIEKIRMAYLSLPRRVLQYGDIRLLPQKVVK